jgi:hypothetical protein
MASKTTATTRLALIIALGLSASCYKDPDVNKIACRAPEFQCPGGYTCKKVSVDVGRCCKLNDVSCGVVALDGATSDTLGEVGQPLWSEAGAPIDGQRDSQQVDVTVADAPVADAPVVEAATGGTEAGATGGATGVDATTAGTGGAGGASGIDATVAEETGKDTADARLADLPSADVAADVPVDSPPDSPGTCPGTQQACTAGGVTTCIAAGACCTNSDCAGLCKMCNASHACVAATGQDDPNGRCVGTCDGIGTCKSKQGQTCQTVAAGCVGGTTCSPDGVCCDTACGASCMACDLAGFVGTCKPVLSGNPHGSGTRTSCGTDPTCGGTCAGKADGTCSYPTKVCGPAASCSGTDKALAQSSCGNGTCPAQTAITCTAGFACAAGSCNTTCTTSADCQTGYNCASQKCTTHKFLGGPCVVTMDVTSTASAIYSRGDDGHIYYNAYTPGGQAGWTAVSGLDATAIASTSDLDCGSNGSATTVQIVALGAMPLGTVLHASGTGSSFSAFGALGLSNQSPSVMGNGGPGVALITAVSSGTPTTTLTYSQYDSTWSMLSQSQSPSPALTKAFTSGADADIIGNGFGTVGFVAFMDDGTMGEIALANYMGTS